MTKAADTIQGTRDSARSARGTARRGSMLLEVLVTVTMLALFVALIGAQILTSVRAAGLIERRQTALLLAESIASRLQAGGFELSDQPQQLAAAFGAVHPGWGWRVSTEQTDDPALMRVHLEVLRGDPPQADAAQADVSSMKTVTEMYTLWALPAKIDLIADLGLSDTDASSLAASLNIDPDNFDPASLAGADIPSLLQQYPQLESLLAMYGIDPSMLSRLDPDTIRNAVTAYMANGGVMPNMPGLPGGDDAGGADNTHPDNQGNGNPPADWNEIARLMNAHDQAGLEEYVRTHNMGGGALSNGNAGAPAGNVSGSAGAGRGRPARTGNSGGANRGGGRGGRG